MKPAVKNATQLTRRYTVAGNPLMTERRIELAAVTLAVILCLQLLYGFIRVLLLSMPEPVIPSAEALAIGDMKTVHRVGARESNEITARPLFWPSRRPMEAVAAEASAEEGDAAQAGELGKVKLLGIFAGEQSSGIIVLVKNSKDRILLKEELVGWTLESVEPDRAVFKNNGQTRELLLKLSDVPGGNGPKEVPVKQELKRVSVDKGPIIKK